MVLTIDLLACDALNVDHPLLAVDLCDLALTALRDHKRLNVGCEQPQMGQQQTTDITVASLLLNHYTDCLP